MDDLDGIWSKRLENERSASTLYQERSQLLEHELSLTRNLLSKYIRESQVETKKYILEFFEGFASVDPYVFVNSGKPAVHC